MNDMERTIARAQEGDWFEKIPQGVAADIGYDIGIVCEFAKTALREQDGCAYCRNEKPIIKDDDCADVVYIMKAKNDTGSFYLVDDRDGHMSWAFRLHSCPMCGKKLGAK